MELEAKVEEVGLKIKKLRKQKDLALKDLAALVGTTSSFLSQVENNKTALSISVLKRISEALDVKMSYLLGEEAEVPPEIKYMVVKKNERKTLQNFGNGIKLQFLTTLDKTHLLEPTIHVLAPRALSGIPPYSHGGQEIIFLLSGRIILHLADREVKLEAGDSCFFNSELEHSFESTMDVGETEILCVSSQVFFD